MIEVSCATCSDIMRHPVRSEFPDTDRVEAEAFARRHENFTSHEATITERPAA